MQNIVFRGHQFMASVLSWGICQKISSNSDALNWGEFVKTDICGHSNNTHIIHTYIGFL